MRTIEQINSFWEATRHRSVEDEVFRRRIVVVGAVVFGFCGLLFAIGLGVVVLVVVAAIAACIGIAALVRSWPRLSSFGGTCWRWIPARLVPLSREARARGKTLAHAAVRGARHVGETGRATSGVARDGVRVHGRRLAHVSTKTARSIRDAGRATTIRFAQRAALIDPTREALRLNATGTQQRRSGRYDEAVEYHRRALELLRSVGDRRGVALTQSNLALALSHAGDDAWAVGLFEEAAATLRELGDEEHEAQIMANLGITHRRHGRPEEADNVLELALSKLRPSSSAYQAIEAELRRAS
jgi:tetratricopeptide (TPR) repeat protein